MSNYYRTNNCGELRIENVGQRVVLSGWVATVRKLGGIVFATLRDHFGVTQLLIEDENMLDGICKETVVRVEGEVLERSSKNPNMETGDIEVKVATIEVLGKCQSVLPFEIADATNTKEDLRYKYRYLDLRNPQNHKNLVMRGKVLKYIRDKFDEMGFLEVQTPILTSSSPEGARDYIVPTIFSKGEFYALPQAPQQFKQLLMVSGYDKYFQIAPCFRNEAGRADRMTGEFYQIDFEMSFATQEDIFVVCENFITGLYNKFTSLDVCKAPFVRIPYKEAIEKYCSDKPDLRNPLLVNDVTDIFKDTEFNAFKDKTIKMIVAPCEDKPRRFYDDLGKLIVSYEGKGLAWLKYDGQEITGSIAKFVTEQQKQTLIQKGNVKAGDSLFFIADTKPMAIMLTNVLRNALGDQLGLIDQNKVAFCWVVDFPFYEINEETGKLDFSHNPFSMPQGGLDALNNKNPLDIVAYQYDLVCNGYEMLSGAVRNHDQETMVKAFELVGYDQSVVERKFSALFNAFSYGAPPHAGGAFGFDRMLMQIMGYDVIREIAAFPLNKNGRDLLMNAPSKIDEATLKELGIKLEDK
ncbi:MAG: aspartate--tRNA ligase [Clostridia bacterium]|nr:aspartate--tRNA ligase [Clostridia bacterium]MBQ8792306.1 aspartate--tRNA ligase [Clostridia bacterium]